MNFLRLSSRVRYPFPTHIYKMLEGQGTLSWLVAGSQRGEGGRWMALGGHHLSLARAFTDLVSLPLLVSMPLTGSMELAWVRGLTRL